MEEHENWLECMVVEEQPLLWIKKTSLTHGTVMLYNGERSVPHLHGCQELISVTQLDYSDHSRELVFGSGGLCQAII